MLRALHASGPQEFAIFHALSFFTFVFCLYAFGCFWHVLARWSKRSHELASLPSANPVGWALLGYILFFTKVIWHINDLTPDLLVTAIVFLAATKILEIESDKSGSVSSYLALGFLLAVGFYAKAILFYFGLFILLALALRVFHLHKFRGPLTATLIFALITAPFVAALSHKLDHLTIGDSGRLNYAWFVDGSETKTWMSDTASAAPLPFFPGAIALNSPQVFNLPVIPGIAYAPWYDASVFDKRSHPVFNFRLQVRRLANNIKWVKEEVLGTDAALLVVLIILISNEPVPFFRRFLRTWALTLPIALVITMYLLVHIVDRFMSGFLLVLWGIAFASIDIAADRQLFARRAVFAGIAVFAAYTVPGALHFVLSSPKASNSASTASTSGKNDRIIAETLLQFGLRPGDSVAIIGDGQEAYWAQWAGLSVSSELWRVDSTPFWTGSAATQTAVADTMRQSGAKAIVWRRDSNAPCPQNWNSFPENAGCIFRLSPP